MRIAVLGAGAMGSWFGGQLAHAGHEVQLLTTNESHIAAVQKHGLELQSDSQKKVVEIAIGKPADFSGSVELLITLTKTFQLDTAMQSIASGLVPETSVLSLQNGLGNAEVIARYAGRDNTFVGMTMLPVDKVAPGIVASKGKGTAWFGHVDREQAEKIKSLVDIFAAADLDIRHDPLVHKRVWEKVAFNCGMNAVCALCHATPGLIHENASARTLVEQAAAEVVAVAVAEGVAIELESVCSTIKFACENHADHIPSMLQDLLDGKRTEVDALNSAVSARGRQAGIETPVNEMLANLVVLAERGHSR